MSRKLAIIGSFELDSDTLLDDAITKVVSTRYGEVDVSEGRIGSQTVVQMTRSGSKHPTPPHAINFRANIAALVSLGVTDIVATAMCGTLRPERAPIGTLIVPDQLIDASKHRNWTYFEDHDFAFVDFAEPFCGGLRGLLAAVAGREGISVATEATYVCVDGPRFETKAEARMYSILGGDLMGMTIGPEAILAREAGICYATIASATNLVAGVEDDGSAPRFQNARLEILRSMLPLIRGLARSVAEGDERPACGCPTAPYMYRQTRRGSDQ